MMRKLLCSQKRGGKIWLIINCYALEELNKENSTKSRTCHHPARTVLKHQTYFGHRTLAFSLPLEVAPLISKHFANIVMMWMM